ncbi:hypothetical protein [Metapseudomonas otitidis]|uniref:hypothetical protein n=1 Tax=Metapseudomonas otitidis TaxID=319939 RepID=UPI0013F696A0|nr:hypothetical protein [Pseudomonas otitidis]
MPSNAPKPCPPEAHWRQAPWGLALLLALLPPPLAAVELPTALLTPPRLHLQPLGALPGLSAWRLHGVFSRGDGQGSATLSLEDGPPFSVRTGDRLPGGVEVLAIQRDRLLLRRGHELGELVILGRAPGTSDSAVASMASEAPGNLPSLPPDCEAFALGGVPLDELQALGGCPSLAE